MLKIRRKCRFTSKLREKYPFLEETKTKGIVVCRRCGARISIESGGNSDIVRHLKSKKHQDAVSSNESITFHYRSKSDPVSTEGVWVILLNTDTCVPAKLLNLCATINSCDKKTRNPPKRTTLYFV